VLPAPTGTGVAWAKAVLAFDRCSGAALTEEGAMQTSNPSPRPDRAQPLPPPDDRRSAHAGEPVHESWGARVKSAAVVLVALLMLVGFLAFVAGLPLPGLSASEEPKTLKKAAPPQIEVVRGKGGAPTVAVPGDVRQSLGIRKGGVDRLATAQAPTEARPLVMSGSTSLDPTRLMRVRARFAPAKVVEIAQVVDDTAEGPTQFRELRSGDHVKKGDLLGVFFSLDVGSKKNDLIDALVQLKLDQRILDASQAAYDKGALPYLDYMAAYRAVEGDYNAIGRAENNLRVWEIPEEDIEAVRKEAEEIVKQGSKRDRSPEHLKAQLRKWATVELRAPDEGTVVERNVAANEIVVDNTISLFQIARVDKLLVVANAPEDELPALHGLSTDKRRWTVRTVGASPQGITGPIADISYIIDVNQHSAPVKGYIPNDGRLRSGQYVTATVQLPPPKDVVEIPTSALADDGKQAVVFVQDGDKPGVYAMRRVEVVKRFDRTVFVRSRFADGKEEQALTPEEKDQGLLPRRTLKPGERVLTAGVLELKKVLDDRAAEGAK
jgi:cobalt-zinc-cadmium efflux system membrane fusion protein